MPSPVARKVIRSRVPVSAKTLVRFTGVCEIAGGVGLLARPTRPIAAASLVVFLAAVFPANAYAARDPERFGAVAAPLVPRAAAQVLLAALIAVVIIGAVSALGTTIQGTFETVDTCIATPNAEGCPQPED